MIEANYDDYNQFFSRRLGIAYDKSFLYSMFTGYWVDTDGFALSGPNGKCLGEKYPGEFLLSSIEQDKKDSRLKRYSLGTKLTGIAMPCANLEDDGTFVPLNNAGYIEVLLRETAKCRDPWTVFLFPILTSIYEFPSGNHSVDFSDLAAEIIHGIIPSFTFTERISEGIVENRSDYALDLFEALYESQDQINVFDLPLCILDFIMEFLDVEKIKEHFPMDQLKGYLDHDERCNRVLEGMRLVKTACSNDCLVGQEVEFDQASDDEIYLYIRATVLTPVADMILSASDALWPTFEHEYSEEKMELIYDLVDMCDKIMSAEDEQIQEMISSTLK